MHVIRWSINVLDNCSEEWYKVKRDDQNVKKNHQLGKDKYSTLLLTFKHYIAKQNC